jgi:hypothetical protein
MRLHTVGLATATACEIKMRQVDLADAVGLGRTHVNPALARLQNEGLVDLGRGYIAVKNIKGLMKAGEFNEDYLHLHREVEPPE